MRKFVCISNPNSERLHCTLQRVNLKSKTDQYTLYLEYLGNKQKRNFKFRRFLDLKLINFPHTKGGFIPLLRAKKTSKLKPDFIIFDPVSSSKKSKILSKTDFNLSDNDDDGDDDDYDYDDNEPNEKLLGSTFVAENNIIKRIHNKNSQDYVPLYSSNSSISSLGDSVVVNKEARKRPSQKIARSESTSAVAASAEAAVGNTRIFKKYKKPKKSKHRRKLHLAALKKQKIYSERTLEAGRRRAKIRRNRNVLVSIRSNIWGTKFKFLGNKYLPDSIGQIVYKTSLFHLQPRQMTITLEDLTQNFEHSQQKSTTTAVVTQLAVQKPSKNNLSQVNLGTTSPLGNKHIYI